jgi:soluble P-type ATPase
MWKIRFIQEICLVGIRGGIMADFKDIKFDKDISTNVKFVNPLNDVVSRMQREQEASLRAMQKSREEKEQEELRRHNELVQTLKDAGDKGATIVIGDNANAVQILQNSDGTNQIMTNSQTFNYEKTLDVLKEIKEYFDYHKFNETFGAQAELIQQIVNQTIDAVQKKEDPKLITKSLKVLKDLAVGAGGSLIASGIIGLLNTVI